LVIQLLLGTCLAKANQAQNVFDQKGKLVSSINHCASFHLQCVSFQTERSKDELADSRCQDDLKGEQETSRIF